MYERFCVLGGMAIGAAYTKKLTPTGIATAVLVGAVHCLGESPMPLSLLVGFFGLGVWATRIKAEVKQRLTNSTESHTGRTYMQVLCNSGSAAAFLMWGQLSPSRYQKVLKAVVAHYAAVASDTLSSELGILSRTKPRLITTGVEVPKGTNGGVSMLGLGASAVGSAVIGVIARRFDPTVSLSSTIGWGLLGTALDSLLGATCQLSVVDKNGKILEASGKLSTTGKRVCGANILTNNEVNLITATAVTALAYWLS